MHAQHYKNRKDEIDIKLEKQSFSQNNALSCITVNGNS